MVTETTLESSSITPAAASTTQISVTGFISQAVTSAPIAMTTVTETAAAAPSVEQVTTSSAPVISSTSTTSDTTTSTTTMPSPISTSTSAPSNAPPMLMGRYGITYSPYKANHQCKSADEVAADFALFASQYGAIRIYGTDCNQVYTVSQAAKAYGNQLFLGIYDVTNVETEVSLMATGLNNDWTMVNTISVGNEYVNNGGDPDTVIAALNQARAALQTAGYAGPMVIVDTFSQVLKFPRLCDESDYCAVNCHAFFDKTSNSSHAGAYLDSVVTQLRSVISDPHTRVVITETGWPWKGDDNGLAVPGLAEQAEAISLIKDLYSETPYDVFLFTAFNDMWKPSEVNTFHAEQFWGLGGVYSPSDKGLITE
ncbi:glycoside hydrolase superfamily [Xylaria sp. CBS 124048]|nr:glycoside hydrolase superfamily [Xylaria sp. CBS 124048]